MKISAELVLASKNAATGDVITTLVLTYPRTILAEVLTHRTLSRNTSSTRAIPAKKMRETVWNDCFIPSYIGEHRKGMVPGPELRGWKRTATGTIIGCGALVALAQNYLLEKLGVAKGISGRYLEPYMWVRQVVTATDWKNFLLLRNHKDAEPHFRELARCVAHELRYAEESLRYESSFSRRWNPAEECIQILQPLEWHIPFLSKVEQELDLDSKLKISAARCARTSYTVTDSKPKQLEEDLALAERLVAQGHLSPLEHQAQAVSDFRYYGNFKSFVQYRKSIANEDGGDRSLGVAQ